MTTLVSPNSTAAPAVQRPMLSLRNDEISAVRHQLPTVYEALVQYDLLYLNAEARVEAKEQELQRCIDVGQEVLQQLQAVRQRCQELTDERDELEDERDELDRKVLLMRQQADQMKSILDQMHNGHHEANTEVEVLTQSLQSREAELATLQIEFRALRERLQKDTLLLETTRTELMQSKQDTQESRRGMEAAQAEVDRLDRELAARRSELVAAQQDTARLKGALEDQERARSLDAYKSERAATEADILSCGSIVAAMLDLRVAPTTISTLRESLHQVHQKYNDFRRRGTSIDEERRAWEEQRNELQSQFHNALEESQQSKKLVDRVKEDYRALQSRLDAVVADTVPQETERALKKLLDERERAILDSNNQLSELRRELKTKDQAVAHLERQLAERQVESRRATAYADVESQLLEARQRNKMHEQTIELLQLEITNLTNRLGMISSLEEELRIVHERLRDADEGRADERKLRLEYETKLTASRESYDQLNATLVAVQEELMEAQGDAEDLREQLRRTNADCAALRSAAVPDLRSALRNAEAENTRLTDELTVLQREVGKLRESLARVARDDASATTAINAKLKHQQHEIESLQEKLNEAEDLCQDQKKQLAQTTGQEQQLREQLEDLKVRMQDYLQSHVPELMFHELENDFKKTRLELQTARQEAIEQEEACSMAKRKLDETQRKYDKLGSQNKLLAEQVQKLLVEPLAAAEKYVTDASSAARRNVVTQSGSLSPPPRHIDTSSALMSVERSSSFLSPAKQKTDTPFRVASCQGIDKIGFALLELYSSLRHRSLEVVRVATSSAAKAELSTSFGADPSSSAELFLRAVSEATAKAVQQAIDTKDSEMEERVAMCQRETNAVVGQLDATKADMSALQAARAQLETELSELRQQWQTASQTRHVAVADLEKERQARRALEAKMDEERRAFEAQQTDILFDRQSMQAKLDQLKDQLAAERQEHQTTVSNLFAELSSVKQSLVHQQSSSHERQAQDARRRQAIETERDEAVEEMNNAKRDAEDAAAQVQRLTNLLRDSKDEIKHVTGLLASYEDSDSHSLQDASERATLLQQRVLQLEAELREAQRRTESATNNSFYRQQVDDLNAQVMDDRRALDALYTKISMLEQENRAFLEGQVADQQELEALLRANALLESRLHQVEADRDPLRRKLHEILDVR